MEPKGTTGSADHRSRGKRLNDIMNKKSRSFERLFLYPSNLFNSNIEVSTNVGFTSGIFQGSVIGLIGFVS